MWYVFWYMYFMLFLSPTFIYIFPIHLPHFGGIISQIFPPPISHLPNISGVISHIRHPTIKKRMPPILSLVTTKVSEWPQRRKMLNYIRGVWSHLLPLRVSNSKEKENTISNLKKKIQISYLNELPNLKISNNLKISFLKK